jgi:hypothetical protein
MSMRTKRPRAPRSHELLDDPTLDDGAWPVDASEIDDVHPVSLRSEVGLLPGAFMRWQRGRSDRPPERDEPRATSTGVPAPKRRRAPPRVPRPPRLPRV